MKFTPETLLQIYLEGSFTDEAQAEFDALMRKDPAFAERVTQALADRLGPVPQALMDDVSARLDGKIVDLWARHKPSPLRHSFKWGIRIALALAAVGGLFIGVRYLAAKLNLTPPSGVSGTASQAPSDVKPVPGEAQKSGLKPAEKKSTNLPSSLDNPSWASQAIPASVKASDSLESTNVPSNPSNSKAATGMNQPALPPADTANQKSLNTNSSSAGSAPQVLNSGASSRAVTSEGNSLRVAIDTDKTEKVDVTVFDANGLLIRHLYNGTLSAGEHAVDWDGKDELGNTVLPGDYTVILDLDGKKMSGILKVLPNR